MRWGAWLAGLLLLAAPAAAQDPPVLLEVPQGPVVNSNRVMGMGGAFVGIAEGADGHLYNPASFAYRYPYTRNRFVDWDWTLYWLQLRGSRNPDLYGAGGETRSAGWLGGGLDLKIGGWGFGFHVYTQNYEFDGAIPRLVSNTSIGVGLAYALPRPDFTLGAYLYGLVWSAESEAADGYARGLSAVAGGVRLGMLWAPRHRPVRVGIVYRTPLSATDVQVDDPTAFAKPDGIYSPGQLSIGGSFMVGERRYNPQQTWGLDRFAEERLPEARDDLRRYVRISYDVVIQAAAPVGTVSMREFIRNPDAPTPIRPEQSIGFRGGVESEVWANWLVLRSGYYFEPARTDVIKGRHHVTGGLAFRIPVGNLVGFWPWDIRVDAAVDIARDYGNAGFGLGFWH